MPDFYTLAILLINQSEEIGEMQLSVFGSRGGKKAFKCTNLVKGNDLSNKTLFNQGECSLCLSTLAFQNNQLYAYFLLKLGHKDGCYRYLYLTVYSTQAPWDVFEM